MPESMMEAQKRAPAKQTPKATPAPKSNPSKSQPSTQPVPATVVHYYSEKKGDKEGVRIHMNVGTERGVGAGMSGYFKDAKREVFDIDQDDQSNCSAWVHQTIQFVKGNKDVVINGVLKIVR